MIIPVYNVLDEAGYIYNFEKLGFIVDSISLLQIVLVNGDDKVILARIY